MCRGRRAAPAAAPPRPGHRGTSAGAARRVPSLQAAGHLSRSVPVPSPLPSPLRLPSWWQGRLPVRVLRGPGRAGEARSPLPCTSLRRRRRRRRLASAAERRQQQEQRQTFPSHDSRAADSSRRGTASRVSRSRRERRGDPGAPGREQESRTHPSPPTHALPAPPPAAAPGQPRSERGRWAPRGPERGPGGAPEPRASGASRRRRDGGRARLQAPGGHEAPREEGGTCLPACPTAAPGSWEALSPGSVLAI